ncbi:MAG: hypothetical protein AABN34_26150 [Acidobacteriota bacterium]
MLKLDSRVLLGVTILSLSYTAGYSLDGGGRSEISPYSSKELITAERVNRQKALARTSMTAAYELNGAKENIGEVGLAWTKAGVSGEMSYQLKGMMNGRSRVVDFSEIQELAIVKTETTSSKVRVLFKVITFPNVSAEQLVNERPTYSELKQKYSRTLELWVDVKMKASGDFCFVGKHVAPRPLEDFKNVAVIHFEYSGLSKDDRHSGMWKGGGEGVWWAIPSVIRDPKYPYRRPVKLA